MQRRLLGITKDRASCPLALRRVMWVDLRFGEAGAQEGMCCDDGGGPGEQAPEGVCAVPGQFHLIGDLGEGGLDPVAPFGDDRCSLNPQTDRRRRLSELDPMPLSVF
jgi:hypothetical protein